MKPSDIPHHRLYNQRINHEKSGTPDQVVAWFGAMQAQDYTGVKWAVGLRCCSAAKTIVEQALVNKTIVRTWLMRGTLQVVAAGDVRWMLDLLAPRMIANSARRYQQLELDAATFDRSYEVLGKVLQGGRQLTRAEIVAALEQAGISVSGQRIYHILRRAGLEGLICFGPMQEKQETFVLFDEWVPHAKEVKHDEALAELAGRYFESHGPAALQDFIWWSGLKAADARTGLELAKDRLHQETIDGQTYWMPQNNSILKDPSPAVYLLPAYDEYFLGYKDRSAVLHARYDRRAVSSNGVFRPVIVIDGQVVGIWKRVVKEDLAIITMSPFKPLTKAESKALADAANQYGAFLGLPVKLAL